ncbi:hypothetical protein HHL22_12400 [Hymenobacter sp. RP-2-7]|uniref:DUF4249 family protein n=1 Tax=Hymenobacter polaris TaxID=2682546 RepID=A0A7Y0AFA1_9BACT|nr:hypothetical protein [Hymenobacter polaris]NML66005.1 hypothetical protein [Hymenobacter polaris]
MTPRILFATGFLLLLLAACTKVSGPLQLYFIGSSRFTSGNRTGLGAGDTLATRVFVAADSLGGIGLKEVRVTVTYRPSRQPFAYPVPLTAFVFNNLPTDEQIVYLDTVFAAPYRKNFLLTSVFGVRTTAGAERWEYTATDAAGNTSTRAFTATARRTSADSAQLYNDYFLRLNVPARGVGTRRFIQLKSGLALPAYTVLGTSANPTPDQQGLTDLVQSIDGLRLFSPDTLGSVVRLPSDRWPTGKRRATRFRLTTLDKTGFDGTQDTTAIRQQYGQAASRVRQSLTGLTVNQVYAFRTKPFGAAPPSFGLLRVVGVPGGSSAGLQLEVRVAKQAQSVAFLE